MSKFLAILDLFFRIFGSFCPFSAKTLVPRPRFFIIFLVPFMLRANFTKVEKISENFRKKLWFCQKFNQFCRKICLFGGYPLLNMPSTLGYYDPFFANKGLVALLRHTYRFRSTLPPGPVEFDPDVHFFPKMFGNIYLSTMFIFMFMPAKADPAVSLPTAMPSMGSPMGYHHTFR